MASYNRVYTEFWPETRDWPTTEQSLALYLLTCEHRRTEGLYRLRPAYMADDLGWTTEAVGEALDGLTRRGWIVYDGSWLCLVGALRLKEQRPAGPKQIAGAVRAVANAPRDSAPYAAFHAAASAWAPDFAAQLDQPIEAVSAATRPPTDTPSEPYSDSSGNRSDSSTSTSSSSSTSCGGERAPASAPPPDPKPALTCPTEVRDMLLAAEFDIAEIEHADSAIRLTLNQLQLPDDVDWPAYGRLIVRYRNERRLTKPGPCPALRFIARRADGPPRLSDQPKGQRSPVDHYAAMRDAA